jgi:hypothetical protein
MIKIGTAWESRGGFHTDIQQNIDLHRRTGKRNHFEFPYDRVIAEKRMMFARDGNVAHLAYEKFVNSCIKRLGGTENLEFRMNFMCIWNESRIVAVSLELLNACQEGMETVEAAPTRGDVMVVGIDFGKRRDSTVVTLGRIHIDRPIVNMVRTPDSEDDRQVYYPKEICDWLELEGPFEGSDGQYARIVEYMMMCGVKAAALDATSLGGDVICERIEAMVGLNIPIIKFIYNVASKSNGYKYYIQEMKAGRLKYPAGPETRARLEYQRFRDQHLALDREVFGNHIIIGAPKDSDDHDDYPDSGMLMCWAEKMYPTVVMPEVQVSGAKTGGDSSMGEVHGSPRRGGRYASRRYRS